MVETPGGAKLTSLRLAIIGDGKMGHAVASLAPERGFEIVARLGKKELMPHGVTKAVLNNADVAVEFSLPRAAAANVRGCIAAGVAAVSGTTGWDVERGMLEREVKTKGGALLWSPNFSVGVQMFARVLEEAARLVARSGAEFDVQMVETHHKGKLDAPSGTARFLVERAAKALMKDIPITSVRTGHVPGTHELLFDAAFEQIRLVHEARDRRVFASGALTAARWITGRRGVFTMDDVLGTGE